MGMLPEVFVHDNGCGERTIAVLSGRPIAPGALLQRRSSRATHDSVWSRHGVRGWGMYL